ncbi:MAG: hypothetical protein ACRYFS_26575 [Janthinobacterium lividum]
MLLGKFSDVSRYSGTFGSTGPTTPVGKEIAARNATTHGLFARDIVLTQLGEDPAAYETIFITLCEQIDPQNLIERHYVEAIAAASWRLRRLHRWQAQIYEDRTLTEDEQIDKLDRVMRHETSLHRQIDKAVRQLGRDVPLLFEGRARKDALAKLEQTEQSCHADESIELEVSLLARDYLHCTPMSFNHDRLDNTNPIVPQPLETEKCQNELPPVKQKEGERKEGEQKEPERKELASLILLGSSLRR